MITSFYHNSSHLDDTLKKKHLLSKNNTSLSNSKEPTHLKMYENISSSNELNV